jgi:antagonist of KipI
MSFEVIDGGLATTIQDGGRADWAHLGVPPSGACDPWSLAVANLVAGGQRTGAAIEMTLIGPTLVAQRSTVIGLAGADLGGRVVGGRRLAPGRSHRIEAGETIAFPGEGPDRRARAYLALPGGVDVPCILGSRSTCLAAGFGGLDGRPLRAGDVVHEGRASGHLDGTSAAMSEAAEMAWPADPWLPSPADPTVLRVMPGPAPGLDDLVSRAWHVGPEADRVGIRLDGERLPDGVAGEAVSHGVTWGAIQVPSDGRPIVLGPDHQTTGGYPVVGVVISADRGALGQLRPGAEIGFRIVDRDEAVAALRKAEVELAAGAAALGEAAGWNELAWSAGG